MLHLIKIIIPLLILSTNALILSAEEISEISEQTFNDKIKEHAPSEENELKSSTPKVGLYSPVASVKKHPSSLVLSLKDAIIRTLSNNISIQVESFNNKIKKESVAESLSEFDATLGLELSTGRKTQQLASAFSSPNRMENDNDNWDLSLSQKLITGANYQFDFTNNRNKTNSETAGLNPSYRSEFQLSLTQPLLKNFGIDLNKSNVHIANNKVDISENEFKTKVIAVVSEIENTYWDFVFSLKDLEVKQKSLERAKDLQRLVKSQVLVGTLAPIETLQAESEVASREEFLLTAQDAIEDNQDKLKNILNIEFLSSEGLRPIYPSTPANIIIEEIDIKESIKMALANRPDYLGKKKDLENKDILVKYQENQIYPSVDLVGSMGLNGLSGEAITITSGTFQGTSAFGGSYGNSLTDSLSTNYYDWEIGVKFSYPLGNRAAKSKLSTSRLEKAQLILDIKDLEREIILDIREAVRQLKTDSKRIKAATVAKQLAEEKLKAEEKKFEVGLSTSFNVLEFQEDLAEAQSNEIKTILDYKQSRIRFRRSTASTLKYHDVTLSAKEST
jgi:outer membrane protein TolC